MHQNEIGEVIPKSGNAVSTGALASLGFWDVDVVVLTRRGRPVAMLKSFDDDSHVETRVSRYEAHNSIHMVSTFAWFFALHRSYHNIQVHIV